MKVSFSTDLSPAVPTDEDFYRTWLPRVRGMARNLRLLDAEIVAQDVVVDFLTAGYIQQWDYTKGKSFESFCFWMMRNRLYSKLRQQKRHHDRVVEFFGDVGEASELLPNHGGYEQPEYEHAEQRVDLRILADEIGGRPGQILAALIAFTETGSEMRDQDVAEAIGCGGTTVQTHRKKLQLALRERNALMS